MRTGLGDDWIRLGALKILSDGSMGSATAAFFEPFTTNPASKGLLLHPVEELERLIREADAAGFQLAVHAIGDRANALVLDAFEKAAQANGPRERRFRIEHAQHVRAADVARYKALGVIASVQPSHCIDDMRFVEKHIGAARLADSYRWKSFLDAGVPLAFGTDWFVEPLDPRLGLYAAVTREYTEGGPAGGFSRRRRSLSRTPSTSTRAARPTRSSRKGARARWPPRSSPTSWSSPPTCCRFRRGRSSPRPSTSRWWEDASCSNGSPELRDRRRNSLAANH